MSLPFDVDISPAAVDLQVAGFQFQKLNGFKTAELILYSRIQSEYDYRTLDLMSLAYRISQDLGFPYLEVFEMLRNENTLVVEFGAYADEIKEIALRDFSDVQRKSELVTMFIRSRCDKSWTEEQTGELLWDTQAELIYHFLMGEYTRWQEPEPTQLDGENVGKSSASLELHSIAK
jgi:hypothetical protein